MVRVEEISIKYSTKAVIIRAVVLILLVTGFTVMFKTWAQDLRYFKLSEFVDRHSPDSEVHMDRSFLIKLDQLRELVGFPLHIRSGYRSRDHPDEINKKKPGTHTKGIAVDIMVSDAYKQRAILRYALQLGFTGIGIYPLHIHLDTRKAKKVLWVREKYNVHHSRDSPRR